MSRILVQQLRAFREMCLAQIALIDSLLPELERPPAPSDPAVCHHPEPQRIKAPVMGHPHRFLCGVCGATGGTTTETHATMPQQEG